MQGTAVDDRPASEPLSAGRFQLIPRNGDVIASKRTARPDFYTIGIVPDTGQTVARRYLEAIDRVQQLAEQLGVDGWFTCDHTHSARVARHRAVSQKGSTNQGPKTGAVLALIVGVAQRASGWR